MLILENDSNAEVRRAVLSCIAMSPRTLPKVLKRTRDIKENVRKLAYQVATTALRYSEASTKTKRSLTPLCVFVFQVLANKVHIKALSIAQRVSLLQQGLRDTSGRCCFLSVCVDRECDCTRKSEVPIS